MTIIPYRNERVALLEGLSDANQARAIALAKAFRARWVPLLAGYALYPGSMGRLEALCQAGYTCAMRAGHWRFGPYGDKLTLDRYEATRRAKETMARWSKEAVCH